MALGRWEEALEAVDKGLGLPPEFRNHPLMEEGEWWNPMGPSCSVMPSVMPKP